MKGKKGWLTPRLKDELDVIKREHRIEKDCLALDKLAGYARIGREIDYIWRGQFDKMELFKKKRRR